MDLSGRDLRYSKFTDSDLTCTDFSNTNLECACFVRTNLVETIFLSADLSYACFNASIINHVDLTLSKLYYTVFDNVSLKPIDSDYTKLIVKEVIL